MKSLFSVEMPDYGTSPETLLQEVKTGAQQCEKAPVPQIASRMRIPDDGSDGVEGVKLLASR